MANGNGKNNLIGWLVKIVVSLIGAIFIIVIVITLPTMAKQIWTNDRNNTKDHKEIRKEISNFSIEQMRQGTILERIDGRVKKL